MVYRVSKTKLLLTIAALLIGFSFSVWPQQQGTDQKRPSADPDRPPAATRTQESRPPPGTAGALLLTGSVVFSKDTPVSSALVELVCHGSVWLQDHASDSGSFTFRIGDYLHSGLGDASVGGPGVGSLSSGQAGGSSQGGFFGRTPAGDFDLRGCEVRASHPGSAPSAIQLGIRSTLDDSDVGVLVLNQASDEQSMTVSLTSLSAPRKAKDAYQKARKELSGKKKNLEKAARALEESVKIFPEYALAWELLGQTRLDMGDDRRAREAFLHAIQAEPEYVGPYLSLAGLWIKHGRWEKVVEVSNQILERSPENIRARYFLAHASFFLGKLDVAEAAARRVQASRWAEAYPGTHYFIGTILAERGEWSSAGDEFSKFLKASPDSSIADPLKRQLKEWERQGFMTGVEIPE